MLLMQNYSHFLSLQKHLDVSSGWIHPYICMEQVIHAKFLIQCENLPFYLYS